MRLSENPYVSVSTGALIQLGEQLRLQPFFRLDEVFNLNQEPRVDTTEIEDRRHDQPRRKASQRTRYAERRVQ